MMSPDLVGRIEIVGRVAIAVCGVAAILWAIVRFIFEPHVRRVVLTVVKGELDAQAEVKKKEEASAKELVSRMSALETRMGKVETGAERQSEAVGRVEQAVERLTRTLERVAETSQQTALTVARIEGTMERRNGEHRD